MPVPTKLRWGLGLGAGILLAAGLAGKSVLDQARTTADAYLFGYPLVLMELTKQHQRTQGLNAPNDFSHHLRFPDHTFNSVVAPNADTLYSSGRLDLRGGPVVLSIPQTGGHYYMMPMLDAWTNVFASPGTRTIGEGAKTYLIAGPGWSGQAPDGMELIQAPTQMAWIIARIKSSGAKDYAEVNALQRKFKLIPLSHWQGKPSQAAAIAMVELPPLDTQVAPDQQIAGWSAETFFSTLCRLLPDNPPRNEDAPMLERLESAGLLNSGCTLTQSPLQRLGRALGYRKVLATLQESDKLLAELPRFNGWRIAYSLGEYGTRYGLRALVAKIGLGANGPEDSLYPSLRQDSEGRPLTGEQRYVLHFAEEQLPPVKGFWSLTLYNQSMRFVDNPINRYAIGDRDDLHYNPDGSLDLYIQHPQPTQPQQRTNWLPAPQGPFNLMLRLYWPKPEVLNQSWLPPQIRRQS